MNVLIVKAHPSTRGFTHQISDVYAESLKENGHDVRTIDLYDPSYHQDFLSFEQLRDITPDVIGQGIRDHISAADEIVLVFPVWWFGVPAIMKNFFDHNFGAGFAFEFTEGKPRGLLIGKTARIFATADGPNLLYCVAKPFFAMPLTKGLLGFCGIKTVSVDIFANRVAWKGTDREGKILAKVRSRATM